MRKETDTKKNVLAFLTANHMTYVSGQEIADSLFMTRANVWKAIKSLQAEGYQIEAVSNRGYRLSLGDDMLYEAGIRKYLGGGVVLNFAHLPLYVYDELDSTNDTAREFAMRGPHEFGMNSDGQPDSPTDLVIVSDYQRRGRGRRGRAFHSPKGTGLYLSFLLHPETEIDKATLITAMTAVAVSHAIESVSGISVQIKWVNDLFFGDKKIAGILTEGFTSIEDGSLDYIIVGIGLNLFPPVGGFPEEIKKTAGVLFPGGQKEPDLRNRLCAAIISEFMNLYAQMPFGSASEDFAAPFIEEYRTRSMLIGSYVKITNFGKSAGSDYAKVLGIDDECKLIVLRDDGRTEHLSTGEVSVVKY